MTSLILAAIFTLSSPDGRLAVSFENDDAGMRWSLSRDGKPLIAPSPLGLVFSKSTSQSVPKLGAHKVLKELRWSEDKTCRPLVYRRNEVRERYNELEVQLEERTAVEPTVGMGRTVIDKSPRRLTMVFRAYDEGVAFRYVIPKQKCFDGFEIMRELTEWRFAKEAKAWVTEYPAEFTSQECKFELKSLAEIDPKKFIGSPVVVEQEGVSVALCEAALYNWAGLFFRGKDAKTLKAHLAELPASEASTPHAAVICATPAASPWRVAIVGDNGLDLLRKNDILVGLNPDSDPSIDFSFVKPGATSWDWWAESNNSLSTETTIKLIDFAAEMGWPYHTIDGGWYGFARRPNHGPNVELKPRKDFDLKRVVEHAKAKGVRLWVWIHWMEIEDTGVEETFRRLEEWGIAGVKTDFINRQDQWIVNWYERVLRSAAKHHVMVNFHGAFKPTGTERTWPNNLTREGILGNEMNIFHATITPRHCLTLPFTRFLIGPGDFTPGGFGNVYYKDFVPQCKKGHRYGDETDRCPHWAEQSGTRGFAIAQCVAYDSYLMTICDWPERYHVGGKATGELVPGAKALKDLPTAWDKTIPLQGRCGEYYAVARLARDGRWYVAAMTVASRKLEVKLDFLGSGSRRATIYVDDPVKTPVDAKALSVNERKVTAADTLTLDLCNEGGAVVIID